MCVCRTAGLDPLLCCRNASFFSSSDLWKLLTQHAYAAESLQQPLDVEAIVASWVDKDRFPLLTVSRDDHDNSAKLTQVRLSQRLRQRLRPTRHRQGPK